MKHLKVIPGREDDPDAIETRLGWGIIRPTNMTTSPGDATESNCHRILTQKIGRAKVEERFRFDTRTKEIMNPKDTLRMFEHDFSEGSGDQFAVSKEDRTFIGIVTDGVAYRNGQYAIPLPMKDNVCSLPNNRIMANNRLKLLKESLDSTPNYRDDYVNFMGKVIRSGHAEKVPDDDKRVADGRPVWHIPHHGVYHSKKPNKVRVVFDCSAQIRREPLITTFCKGQT